MIAADAFLGPARDAGYDFYTGVPCSFLTPVINRVISASAYGYVPAASEGEAVAIAAGAWLAGRKTVVMMQNSGLGNAVNPLTSLNFPFRIPSLLIVTWRGGPGLTDEPQHELMGEITPELLDVIRVPQADFPSDDAAVGPSLKQADTVMDHSGLPFAFIMQKGAIAPENLSATSPEATARGVFENMLSGSPRPSRFELLERMLGCVPETAAIVATTGKTGRELFTIEDRAQHIYQVGSMGGAVGMGLGIAMNVDNPVVVVDGDGAALMKLGSLATVGAERPSNLIHLILDNGTYESTGGQPTVSEGVDFASVAVACGYPQACLVDDAPQFERALINALESKGPHLIHAKISPGSLRGLGRPTVAPFDVARRFQAFLASR